MPKVNLSTPQIRARRDYDSLRGGLAQAKALRAGCSTNDGLAETAGVTRYIIRQIFQAEPVRLDFEHWARLLDLAGLEIRRKDKSA